LLRLYQQNVLLRQQGLFLRVRLTQTWLPQQSKSLYMDYPVKDGPDREIMTDQRKIKFILRMFFYCMGKKKTPRPLLKHGNSLLIKVWALKAIADESPRMLRQDPYLTSAKKAPPLLN